MTEESPTPAGSTVPEASLPGTEAACAEPTWREADRLAALERYAILDTGREAAFDEVAELAADLLDAPMGVVNLIASDRQWFKAEVGIGTDSLPLDVSICRHAILQPGVMVVPDLRDDPRFEGNPLIHVAGGLRFYAGALLETPEGLPLGTVCVLDREPRPQGISERQHRALSILASQVIAQIELRRAKEEVQATARRQAFLLRLDEALRAATSPDEAKAAAAELLGRDLDVGRVTYMEVDEDASETRVTCEYLAHGMPPSVGVYRLAELGPVFEAYRTGEPLVVEEHRTDPRTAALARLPEFAATGVRSVLGVPLLRAGRIVGVLVVNDASPRRWTGAEIELVQAVAERTRAAVERAAAEAALRESEARAREQADEIAAIYAAAPIGLTVLDTGLRYVRINDRMAEINGLPTAEHIGRTVREVAPDLDDKAIETLRRVLAGEAVMGVEFTGTTPAQPGVVRIWRENWLPLRDASGAVVGVTISAEEVTEERAAEAARRASEERFRAIVETATDYVIFTTDAEGRIVTWTAGAQAVLGWTAEEAVGQPADMTYTPEDRAQGVPEWERRTAREEGQAPNVRWHRRKDGTRVFIDGVMRPLDGQDGAPSGYVKVGQDVTDRRAIEEALRASEARFRLMADAVPQIVWITDAEGRTEFFNKQWTDYTGAAYEPATAAEVAASFVHPDDAEATVTSFDEARRTDGTFLVEHRIRSKAGDWRWFLVRGEPYRDLSTGAALRWFGASVDIHDRKRAEAALRELNDTLEARVAERTAEREQLARIVETTGTLIQALDTDLRWIAVNRATSDVLDRLYGRRPHLGQSLHEFFAGMPEHLAEARVPWDRALAGEALTIMAPFGDLGHERRTFELTYEVLRDEDSRVTGALMTGFDVTERLRDQARLAEAEEQLRQAQKMDAMGQLTGGVAHDFNNLLTPIVAVLDRLQRQEVIGPREQRLITGAAQSAERARTLVQRLLAFARRQPLQAVAVDVADLVRGMTDLVASTTGPQVRVAVEVADDLPPAKADSNQLEMALLNLAVNARDAMPEGGTLRISATAETVEATANRKRVPTHAPKLAPGRYLRLSVADTGSGMDEATLARAVEPFFSTKGVGKGTGLGLSMVHGLASQLGGALAIQSRPGLGTNVELWLPQSHEAPEAAIRPPLAAPNGPRGTALLVDDEEAVRLSTADMLGELGFHVLEAASAEEALAAMRDGARVDLVVTDHLMPGMTGSDLARAVQALRPGLPILVVSGYAESEGLAPDLPRLAKPFRKDELAASLASLRTSGAS
ncbi:PAS domain S-box protein [Rubellimicrobium rubrum]|uniref:histidine kinase n=1 Tax=Rubellimicrobium rubrum TaxID=2585369 RepID=A0A5C4MW71_9RHOB|nr:PAS domain S-box protein [Rubellimicrobium rubrum]TNC49604.1 PAS domain S-box protein [Rubellimicrobium rubrum]